jgi:hypothetical protein
LLAASDLAARVQPWSPAALAAAVLKALFMVLLTQSLSSTPAKFQWVSSSDPVGCTAGIVIAALCLAAPAAQPSSHRERAPVRVFIIPRAHQTAAITAPIPVRARSGTPGRQLSEHVPAGCVAVAAASESSPLGASHPVSFALAPCCVTQHCRPDPSPSTAKKKNAPRVQCTRSGRSGSGILPASLFQFSTSDTGCVPKPNSLRQRAALRAPGVLGAIAIAEFVTAGSSALALLNAPL